METLMYLASPILLLAGALGLLVLDLIASEKKRAVDFSIITVMILLASMTVVLVVPVQEPYQVMSVLLYDKLTRLLWVLAHITLIAVVVIGKDYVKESIKECGLYYSFYLLSSLGVELLVASTDILMLFLSMDFLSVLTYVLTGYLRDDIRSIEAATKYLVYGAVLSALMAFGLSWLYGLTGTTNFTHIAAIMNGLEPYPLEAPISVTVLYPILVFITAGLAYKVAAAPFHQWAPDAYDGAPISVTAFLAVLPKLAGLGAFLRVSMVLLPVDTELGNAWHTDVLLFTALFSMTFGNLAGLWQNSLKRLMAYSSIAQIGYILLGMAIGTMHGYRSTIFFLAAYIFADLAIFAVLLTLSQRDANISDLRGLMQKQPLLALVFIWAVLSLTGFPGTGGFLAKFTLINAGLASENPWMVIIVVINTVISVGYYWRLLDAAFTAPETTQLSVVMPDLRMGRLSKVIPVVSAVVIAILGLMPGIIFRVIDEALYIFH